jgi:hypothetical protein
LLRETDCVEKFHLSDKPEAENAAVCMYIQDVSKRALKL